MKSVLVIDDELQIRRFLRAGLELDGFTVHEAENAAAGLKAAAMEQPDLIILDLDLPDLKGSEVMERIRGWSNVPIIVLSIEAGQEEKVRLLKLGADDYVVKPFGMAELLARSEAALRRYFKTATANPIVQAGPIKIDLAAKVVTSDGTRIKLTRKEYKLLHLLAAHAGLVVMHQQLLNEIWGANRIHNIQYLRILARKVRQKIEAHPTRPSILLTESGVGYRLAVDAKRAG